MSTTPLSLVALLEPSMLKAFEPRTSTGNHLLDGLSAEDLARLPFRDVTFTLGEVIYEVDQQIDYAYFPTSSVVSYLYTTDTGATTEMAIVGNDGMIGIAPFLGSRASPHRAVTQIGGRALRIPARALQQEFACGGPLQQQLLRYMHALMTQISQTAVCNRLHPLEQRLCRWLLLCHDRVGRSEILMTQEVIGNMVGGRRESVTVAAGHLQDLGVISYSRGHITIIDRASLEQIACECYHVVQQRVNGTNVTRQNSSVGSRNGCKGAGGESFGVG
jgi:CRP-like cAMP-binding protein